MRRILVILLCLVLGGCSINNQNNEVENKDINKIEYFVNNDILNSLKGNSTFENDTITIEFDSLHNKEIVEQEFNFKNTIAHYPLNADGTPSKEFNDGYSSFYLPVKSVDLFNNQQTSTFTPAKWEKGDFDNDGNVDYSFFNTFYFNKEIDFELTENDINNLKDIYTSNGYSVEKADDLYLMKKTTKEDDWKYEQKELTIIDTKNIVAVQIVNGVNEENRMEWTYYNGKNRMSTSIMISNSEATGFIIRNYYTGLYAGGAKWGTGGNEKGIELFDYVIAMH